MPRDGGLVGRATRLLEQTTGYGVAKADRLNYLEESDVERRAQQRELDLLAFTTLDYFSGRPQDMTPEARRKLAQKSRVAWKKDPQAGASVELMNDFCLGRGVQKPKAVDPKVQDVIDDAWDDEDNQAALTSRDAQFGISSDLSLQANVFMLLFDDGEDGKVKLGVLQHDSVENAVRDPDNRLRVLYFVATEDREDWDFDNDMAKSTAQQVDKYGKKQVKYYAHWRNVDKADEEERDVPAPPAEKLGDGKVFHLSINRTTEMVFGHPPMDRTLRWFNAYNRFMEARVDVMAARAAFSMKRKVDGTPSQLEKMATQSLNRRGEFGRFVDPEMQRTQGPFGAGNVLAENMGVTHEELSLDTGSASAVQDGQMLGGQVSAATRFPRSYYGDASNSTLATATSLELPVLKAVEARQEVLEATFRWFIDRVIERAVETGKLDRKLTPEERQKLIDSGAMPAPDPNTPEGDVAGAQQPVPPQGDPQGQVAMSQAHEDAVEDEADTERDLSYDFSMPNPLSRAMADLITAIGTLAKTFDPMSQNTELSRVLLTIALGEGLEVDDPASLVERIFPPGFTPASMQPQQPPGQFGEFGQDPNADPATSTGADGQQHSADNPYGGPMSASTPESMQQAANGSGADRLPDDLRTDFERQASTLDAAFEAAMAPLVPLAVPVTNGNGKKN